MLSLFNEFPSPLRLRFFKGLDGLNLNEESPLQRRLSLDKICEEKKLSEMEEEKRVKSILEKLNPLNIEQASEQIKNIGIDNAATLAALVSLIYDEALKKPVLYSNLCFLLAEAGELPEFSYEDNENISFRRLLVNKCQVEFDRNKIEQDEANKVDEEKEKMGNVRLIGELFRMKMFPEKMMNHCVMELVRKQDEYPDDDHVEALLDILLSPIDKKHRQLMSILKELNQQNIEQVPERIKHVNIDNRFTLRDLVYQIYYKGLEEPGLSASLCFGLAGELPEFNDEDNETISFRRSLLKKCLGEFQRGMRERAKDEEGSEIKPLEEGKKKKKVRACKRMLGNITLIGELYKKKMLTQRIIHECVQELLGEEDENPDEEVVEALCILMSTIGEMIDNSKAKKLVDAYFDVMMTLSFDKKLSSKVRSMLRDVIELREKQWQKVNQDMVPEKMMNCCVMELQGEEGQEIDDDNTDARGILASPIPKKQRRQLKSNLKELHPQKIEEVSERIKNVTVSSQHGQCSTSIQKELIHSHQSPLRIMHKAEKRSEVGKVSAIEEARQRQLKVILNKMMPQNFDKLLEQVKDINIDNVVTLTGVISQIFDKALTEPNFCEMYANLCLHLATELPDFSEDNEKITFKRLLLNKCQEEFERGEREEAEADGVEGGGIKLSEEEREKKKVQDCRRKLGNIRLIGELYKKKFLTERILHECIKKLLWQYQNPDEEDVEALCILMITIGEMIDHPKAKEHMDAYFDMMMKLSIHEKLSSRVRSILRDVIELRKKRWQKVDMDPEQDSRWSRGSSSTSWTRRGQPIDYGPRWSTVAFSPRTQQGRGIRGGPPAKWRKIQGAKRVEEVHGNLRNANDSVGCVQGGSSTEIENVSSQAKVSSEECLREMSISAIREFYR